GAARSTAYGCARSTPLPRASMKRWASSRSRARLTARTPSAFPRRYRIPEGKAETPMMEVSIRPYRGDDAWPLHEASIESVAEVRPYMPWCRSDLTVEDARSWIAAQTAAFAARTAFEFVIVSSEG